MARRVLIWPVMGPFFDALAFAFAVLVLYEGLYPPCRLCDRRRRRWTQTCHRCGRRGTAWPWDTSVGES